QVATAVMSTAVARRSRPWPVEEASRVPNGASILACSARNRPAPPSRARPEPKASRGRATGGSIRPDTARPVTAAPTSRVSPAYRARRAAVAAGDGDGVSPWEALWVCSAALVAGTPTPKANDPAVTWPSSLDTTRQLTV